MSRVLIVTNLYPMRATPWGGSFVTARVEAMRRAGHEVQVLAIVPTRPRLLRVLLRLSGRDPAPHGALEREPFELLEVPMSFIAYLVAWWGHHPRIAVRRAARLLREKRGGCIPDVLIGHGMYMIPAGAVVAEVAGNGPYSVVCHGSDINVLMQKRRRAYTRVLDDAAAAVFVSTALASKARALGMSSEAVHVIPNGVDLESFTPDRRADARARLGLAKEPVAAFVGGLLEIKGADRLPIMADELLKAVPSGVVLVGGAGPLQDDLVAFCPSNVRLLGRLERQGVADVMAAADVLVIPSRSEGWPTVIMEALASGTTVVGTDVGGIREALGGVGTVVPSTGDVPREMARAILDIWAGQRPEPARLRAIAANYSWDALAAREVGAAS